MKQAEFDGIRSELYEQAITDYPLARIDDIRTMHRYLNPLVGERILGFGEGNGFFCKNIAESVGPNGSYLVTDPSKDQLANLEKRIQLPQVEIKQIGAEGLDISPNSFDKIWSFGAFHHCPDQTEAMKRIYGGLKNGGKVVICDVFQGSPLAKHFDQIVARYCFTGHEVKFLSKDFADTLAYLAGFDDDNVEVVDLPQRWRFTSEHGLGDFIYKLHALTKISGTTEEKVKRTIEGCKEILGVEKYKDGYELHWPMKALICTK